MSEIRKLSDGVRIVYHDRTASGPISITAAYAIVTIPLPVLAKIENDFSPPFRQAIASTVYDNAVKLAWQSPRFWETEDHIYGGISFVKGETTLVWYPSDGFQNPNGIPSDATIPAMTRSGSARCLWPTNSVDHGSS